MYMMSAAWASLAIVLSGLGATYGWFAWKSQGLRGLVRGAALTMLPIALWLTGTLRFVGYVVDWFAGWATGLILSPSVILGTVLFVLAVVLFGASSRVPTRGGRPRGRTEASRRPSTALGKPERRRSGPVVADDGLEDIEALLRKHGIS